MTYPGNPSLAQETKDRIVSTYNQTLDLAGKGRGQEAALGCDFILKMDPLFSPARQLQTRLQGASGPVDVSDLQPLVQDAAAPTAPVAVAAPVAAPVVAPAAVATVELTAEPEIVPLEAIVADVVPPPVAAPILPPVAEERIEFPPPEAQLAEPVQAVVSEGAAPEGNDRITELLGDGQGLFERGDYQAAIDAWSRIFLIDIDHQEAAERIELARKLKDEQERKLDELLSGASELRDAGNNVGARDAYGKILEIQPNHPAAVDALQRLDAAGREDGPEVEMLENVAGVPADLELPETDLYDPDAEPPPPQPAEGAASGAPMASFGGTVQKKKKSKTLPLIAAAAALALAAGGFYLWSNKDSLFPNSDPPPIEEAAAPKLPQADPIEKATGLFEQGQTDMAITRLEEIEEGDSYFERAQQQLAVWRDQLGGAEEAPDVAEINDDVAARRDLVLERARQHYSSREYLAAAKAFRAADKLAALDGAARDLYDDSRRQLLPIRQQIDFFNQREWERLLPDLWQLHLKNPENRDIKRLLADSYYNLGVRSLQRGAVDDAHDNMKEAAALHDDDLVAQRVLEFCQGYQTEPRDLLFKIFVKQLKLRR